MEQHRVSVCVFAQSECLCVCTGLSASVCMHLYLHCVVCLTERKAAIEAAIQEAKAASRARLERVSVQSEAEKKGKYTASQLLGKFFKRASSEAKKNGEAQLKYEQMVRKAERKLSEVKRKKIATSQDTHAKAEAIAQELFHKPGSLLTKQEIAKMWEESGCQDLRQRPRCNFPTVNQFRTVDGTCNNRRSPLYGAAGTNFRRLVPALYEDGISSLRGTLQARGGFFESDKISPFTPPNPSPRLISLEVVENRTQDELPFSHLLMQWGQFLDHDLDLSPELEEECEGCTPTEICEPILVLDADPAFGEKTPNEGDCIPLRRSLPSCEIEQPLSFSAREQINDITSFIDGSMIYGSRPEVAAKLREFRDGLLRVGPNFPGSQPSLPTDVDDIVACMNAMDCFLCGDIRCNEQISLTIIHTYWVREHNRCARELGTINPHWEDERLYQECRKIVGALIQKITYDDYLPKVFGVPAFNDFVGPYPGYMPEVDAGVPNSFATAAYRYGHSLVRPMFDRLDVNYRPLPIGPLNLVDMFFNPDQFRASLGTDAIARGWVNSNSRRMDEFVNSVLTTQLFQQSPASPGLDLASLNIQRGRDHGLPPYDIFRNFCFRVFGQISDFENSLTLVRFLRLYGTLETVDLWVGGLAEARLPESLLGSTFACIFGLTFQAVRNGDRFWYERGFTFTRAQRREIKRGTLSRVLCDNSDNMLTIQPDAFLTNQTRVSCDSLPRVDLTKWKEDVCYFRVAVLPSSRDERILALTRTTRPSFVFTQARVRASRSRQFECIQMQCPTDSAPTEIITLSAPRLPFTVDSSLPPTRFSPGVNVYGARWPRSQLQSGRGGVFSTLKECQSSQQVAITFQGAPFASEQSDDEEPLPDSVLKALDEDNPNVSAESIDSHKVEVAETASDSELLKELEDALQSLQ